MEKTHIISVKDIRRIKKITPRFPQLMQPNYEQRVKWEYEHLLAKKEELYHLRERVWELEKTVNYLESEWKRKSDFFEIEFETTEREVKTTKSNMLINGATVYDCNKR